MNNNWWTKVSVICNLCLINGFKANFLCTIIWLVNLAIFAKHWTIFLTFFLPDKLFLFSFFSTSWYSHLGHFFRKWYITFQYFSKFINIKFNIKKYQDTGEFYSFNGFSRRNRAVYEHFHIYYKCKILYKNIFVLKDVKNPSITCLDYLHVRQSPPLP